MAKDTALEEGQIYWHLTNATAAPLIMRQGFKINLPIKHGRESGDGVYLLLNPEIDTDASAYGEYAIRCRLKPGVRILWRQPYDNKVIASIKKEFGLGILKPDFWKAIPHNKRLTKREAANLWFYLDSNYKTYRWKGSKNKQLYRDNYSRIYSIIKAFNYGGVGIAEKNWSQVVVFNPSDLEALSLHTFTFPNQRIGPEIPAESISEMEETSRNKILFEDDCDKQSWGLYRAVKKRRKKRTYRCHDCGRIFQSTKKPRWHKCQAREDLEEWEDDHGSYVYRVTLCRVCRKYKRIDDMVWCSCGNDELFCFECAARIEKIGFGYIVVCPFCGREWHFDEIPSACHENLP